VPPCHPCLLSGRIWMLLADFTGHGEGLVIFVLTFPNHGRIHWVVCSPESLSLVLTPWLRLFLTMPYSDWLMVMNCLVLRRTVLVYGITVTIFTIILFHTHFESNHRPQKFKCSILSFNMINNVLLYFVVLKYCDLDYRFRLFS